MSLLLQALQKAAKNREASAATMDEQLPVRPPEPEPEPLASILPTAFTLQTEGMRSREPELTLAEEDLFEPEEPLPEPDEEVEAFVSPAAPSSAEAAAILRASETPTAGWIDRVRERPVHAFAGAAGVFLLFYFGYVYLQMFHPGVLRGDFLQKPMTARTPPPNRPLSAPTSALPTPQTAEPAAVSSLPSSAAVAAELASPSPSRAGTTASAVSTASSAAVVPSATPPTRSSAQPPATAALSANATAMPSQPPAIPAENVAEPKTITRKKGGSRATSAPPAARIASSSVAELEMEEVPETLKRGRRKQPAPVLSLETMAEEISSTPAQPGGETVNPGLKEAYQAMQAGRSDRAETLYRGVMEADARNVDALIGLATIAAQRGDPQQAIGFYERALELEPRNAVAQAGLIGIVGQADPQMSEARLKQLIAREPSAFLHFSLGNLYASQHSWPAAQQAYFQAYQMQSDNPDYAYNLAVGLEHINQQKLALSYYRKAIDLSFQKGRANFDQTKVIERIGQLSTRVD
jgi:Tfp pilus assembly protein PilF